jgi:uncharacterized delta-60 repeat protein
MATDTTPPTIAISSNKTALKAGDTALITFTLSEPATDFVVSDVVVSGGTLSNFSGSGTNYTAIFTPAANSTAAGSVSVGNFKFSDAAGNANEDAADANNKTSFTVDTIPPTATISSNRTYLGYGESAQITFTLSEPSPNFSVSSVSFINGTLTNFSGSGIIFSAQFTPIDNSPGYIQIKQGTFSDVIGNTFSGQTQTISIVPFEPLNAYVVWTKLLGTNTVDIAQAVATGLDGSIYILGITNGNIDNETNNGSRDIFVANYKGDGTKVWTKLLGTPGEDEANALTIGADGSIYVAGTLGYFYTTAYGFLAKYNQDGSIAWRTNLVLDHNIVQVSSLKTAKDGAIYVAGNNGLDAFIAKYNTDGTKVWTSLLSSPSISKALALTTSTDGSIYLAGKTSGDLNGQTNSGFDDAFIAKFNPDGTMIWTRLLGSSGNESSNALTTDTDGFIYMAGYSRSSSSLDGQTISGYSDAFIAKYDPDGKRIWTTLYGSPSYDYASALSSSTDGSLYMAGTTGGNIDGQVHNGMEDAFIIKFNTNGAKIWTKFLGSAAADSVNALALDPDGSIYLSGYTGGDLDGQVNGGNSDAFLIKLTSPDTSLPTIAISSNRQSLNVGEEVTLSVSLSKPSTNFVLSDLSAQGGTLGNFQGSGTSYTATFTAGLDAPNGASVSVGSGKFSDALGQFNEDGAETNNRVSFTIATPTYSLTASGTSVNEGSSATFSIVTANIAPGFSLPYTLSGMSAADITGGALTGTVTVDANGKAMITVPVAADKRTEGEETLTVTVQGQVASITIKDTSVNTNPVAANAAGSTNEDTALAATLPTANDADGDPVTYAKATNPSNGTATVTTGGSYTYTPTANYNGPDSFTYTVSDNQGGSNTYTVNLTVNAVNDAPVASAGTLSAIEDTTATGTLLATDVDNTNLTYSVVSQPTKGSVTLGANGSYTYTPAKDANGSDSFTFRASDGALSSNTATVAISVAAVNDAPVVTLSLSDQSTLAGSAFAYTFPSNAFTDVDSVSLAYSASLSTGAALPAWLSFNATTGTFSGTPGASNAGSIEVRVIASDGSLLVNDVFGITVSDRPVATSFQPADGAKAVAVGSNLLVTFNGPVQRGTGPVTLKTADGKVVETFTTANATTSGSTLTLNPTADLSIFTRYVVELGAGAVKDAAGNGNAADSSYDFQTATQDGLYHFFVVAFAAAPGATYMGQLAEAVNFGLPLNQIVEIFTTKKQFTDVYPATMSNRELASQLVNNIVKNSASVATKQSAIDDIDAALGIGWSRGKMLYTVFGNLASKPLTDATWGSTAKQFQNQLAVARYFTEEMGVQTETLSTLRGVIGNVTPDTDVSTVEKIVQIIGTIPPGG